MTNEINSLIDRLRKVEGGPFPNDAVGTCWYRNPDGPEAADRIEALSAECEALREALARTQWMLEAIVRTNSTNFAEVHERIIANRAALSPKDQSNGLSTASKKD